MTIVRGDISLQLFFIRTKRALSRLYQVGPLFTFYFQIYICQRNVPLTFFCFAFRRSSLSVNLLNVKTLPHLWQRMVTPLSAISSLSSCVSTSKIRQPQPLQTISTFLSSLFNCYSSPLKDGPTTGLGTSTTEIVHEVSKSRRGEAPSAYCTRFFATR